MVANVPDSLTSLFSKQSLCQAASTTPCQAAQAAESRTVQMSYATNIGRNLYRDPTSEARFCTVLEQAWTRR